MKQLTDEQRLQLTARNIRARWNSASKSQDGPVRPSRLNIKNAATYAASAIEDLSADFAGDWRSADSWQRFDLQRVRWRSRQVERGSEWGKSFTTSLLNNVLGHMGFRANPKPQNSAENGDTISGLDEAAKKDILAAREIFERRENFTTRKRLNRRDTDRLLLSRMVWDGEFILRRQIGFANDTQFAWQIIDPDYLDHNLNRIEPNGNMTKMGVELDKKWKFPVAYWFLKRRPNDYFYNYSEVFNSLYERVPASEIIHCYQILLDPEQTRGFPWVFAAIMEMFRMGKLKDAALINATVGASKMGFFKKLIPDGWEGDPNDLAEGDETGSVVEECTPGQLVELPWNFEPVQFDFKYPDAELEPFSKLILRGMASSLGLSYMTLTGDVSDANFSSMRAGDREEKEFFKSLQQFFVDNYKQKEWEEWLYWAQVSRNLKLPIAKFDKFKAVGFTPRRWGYVNPVDDAKADEMALNLRIKSPSMIIRENGDDPEEVWQEIASDEKRMKELGFERIQNKAGNNDPQQQDSKAGESGDNNPTKTSSQKKKANE